jgi:hypothetical protein
MIRFYVGQDVGLILEFDFQLWWRQNSAQKSTGIERRRGTPID